MTLLPQTLERPEVETSDGTKDPRKRHLVAFDEAKDAYDERALCGYLTASVHVEHNGSVCQKCVEISKTIKRK